MDFSVCFSFWLPHKLIVTSVTGKLVVSGHELLIHTNYGNLHLRDLKTDLLEENNTLGVSDNSG